MYRSAYKSAVTSNEICVYCDTKDPIVKVSEFLNSLGYADYARQGGDLPAIFIRINRSDMIIYAEFVRQCIAHCHALRHNGTVIAYYFCCICL